MINRFSIVNRQLMQVTKFQLRQKSSGRLFVFVQHKKYELLLFSFMLLIFGNTFTPHNPVAGVAFIYQNLLIGFIAFYHKKWLRSFILCLILFSVALDLFEIGSALVNVGRWHGIIYILFFSLVSKEVFQEVLYVKTVSRELLAAVLCGFVLLCLIGTFLFNLVETEQPHSFGNTGGVTDVMSDLNYFSFTTLLTIGYGDITPVSLLAKRSVMLLGLAGHFYTVFITSIIIGKYLSANKEPA